MLNVRSVAAGWESVRLDIEGSQVQDSLETLHFVFEQDTLSSA